MSSHDLLGTTKTHLIIQREVLTIQTKSVIILIS